MIGGLTTEAVETGERLYPKSFIEAGEDHRERYHLALNYIKPNDKILDAASGSGYGSYYMAVNTRCHSVTSVDISDEALNWGNHYFPSNKVIRRKVNLEIDFTAEFFEAFDVITCFETIEHLKDDSTFVQRIDKVLKRGGLFLISAPNEDLIPHTNNPFFESGKNPFHERHYRTRELESLVINNGFHILSSFTQFLGGLLPGQGGFVNVLVCTNVPVIRNQTNDLDNIILVSNHLKNVSNNVHDSLNLISLAHNFINLVKLYDRLPNAIELIDAKLPQEALEFLEGINPEICPEVHFYQALSLELMGRNSEALEKYNLLLNMSENLKPTLINYVIARAKAIT